LLSLYDDLQPQLVVRNLFKPIRHFLREEGATPASGWAGIRKRIDERRKDPAFAQRFNDFIRDAVLASDKHVYVLTSGTFDFATLAPDLPDAQRDALPYLAAKAPPTSPDRLAWKLEQRSIGSAEIHTFLSVRTVTRTVEVENAYLTDKGRAEFGNDQVIARKVIRVRCYDQLIRIGDLYLMLLDVPPGVDAFDATSAEVRFGRALRDQLGEGASSIFTDLFPAVETLWNAKAEGIVNSLRFVSNHGAEILGQFSPKSTENYREHEFQKAGAKAAQVIPFKIAVKWTARPGHPMVILPGRREMATAIMLDAGNARGSLHYMGVVGYTTWDDFLFVLDRVRSHLPKAKPTTSTA
jgi:hypothetical protein